MYYMSSRPRDRRMDTIGIGSQSHHLTGTYLEVAARDVSRFICPLPFSSPVPASPLRHPLHAVSELPASKQLHREIFIEIMQIRMDSTFCPFLSIPSRKCSSIEMICCRNRHIQSCDIV